MATATVLKFMQKTAEDEALRQQLETLSGVGDGNISSEADLDPAETITPLDFLYNSDTSTMEGKEHGRRHRAIRRVVYAAPFLG